MTVSSIFANFWSCWSLMNLYATMLHTEDLLHRLYYVAHIFTSFLMAVAIDHPDHTFFAHRESERPWSTFIGYSIFIPSNKFNLCALLRHLTPPPLHRFLS